MDNKLTTIRRIWIPLAAAAMSACGSGADNAAPVSLKYDTTVAGTVFSVETQAVDSGFGYSVSVDGKKYINQTIIPVIEGYHSFQTQQDALNTGKLVIMKMLTSNDLPALTKEDLVALGILSPDGTLIDKK